MTNPIEPVASVRLDQWLWAARWFKTRSLAKSAVEAHRVQVDGQPAKAARAVRVGDRIDLVRANERYAITVLALASERGPAKVAETLYAESDESRAARMALREQRRLEANGYRAPQGKPDKRARRLIRALGDLDAL